MSKGFIIGRTEKKEAISSLNFTVVGGTEQPTSPVENTLWVNTESEITEYTILPSIYTPENPVEGMVWIVNAETSTGAVDAIKENSLFLYPIEAYQYISDEWVPKVLKVYSNNTWIDIFRATINISYPEGAVCQCSDGSITYTAPDTSGSWTIIVPNQGTWTVSGVGSEAAIYPVDVDITENEQVEAVELVYFNATITVTYPRGTLTVTGEGQSFSHSGGGTATFTVTSKGAYTAKAVTGSLSNSSTASITEFGQNASVALSYKKLLYTNGTQNVAWGIGYGSNPKPIFNSTYVASDKLGSNDGYQGNSIYTTSKINVTDYVSLYCDGYGPNGNIYSQPICAGLIPDAPVSGTGSNKVRHQMDTAVAKVQLGTSRSTKSLNISGVSGSYHVAVGGNGLLYVYNVWLE